MGFHASDGSISWKVTASGSTTGAATKSAAGYIYRVGVDSSDNVYCLADKDENGNDVSSGQILHKFNSSGVRQWTVDLSADDPGGVGDTSQMRGELLVDTSGNSYVLWNVQVSGDSTDNAIYVIKYNSSGTKQWTTNDLNHEISANTNHVTNGQSVDLKPVITDDFAVRYMSWSGSNIATWLICNVDVANLYHEAGIEVDTSGNFSRTWTPFDVSSSPTRNDVWQETAGGLNLGSHGELCHIASGGDFYCGDTSNTTKIIKNTSGELLSWTATTTGQPLPGGISSLRSGLDRGVGTPSFLDSSDNIWCLVSGTGNLLEWFNTSTGAKTTVTNGGSPVIAHYDGTDILISSRDTDGADKNVRTINTSGVTQQNFDWPVPAATLISTSTGGCVAAYPARF